MSIVEFFYTQTIQQGMHACTHTRIQK